MPLPPQLRAYAETPDRFAHVPAGGSVTRYADERACILEGPTWASVSGVGVGADEVEVLVAEVRARVPAAKEPVWWIGPSASPPDLAERLLALGLREPRDRVGLVHALVLTRAPAPGPAGVEVRRVETYEDFVATREVQWEAFDTPEARRERNRARTGEDYDEFRRLGVPVGFLATVDGRPAAAANAVPSDLGVFLIAGATAPWARGRGLYRALVRRRWDYAVERGTPFLVTDAIADTSYPVLRRLGFEEVCTIRRLEDVAEQPEG